MTPLYLDDEGVRAAVAPHLSRTAFARLLPALEAEGFPKRNHLFKGRHWEKVKAWVAVREGLGGGQLSRHRTERRRGTMRGKRKSATRRLIARKRKKGPDRLSWRVSSVSRAKGFPGPLIRFLDVATSAKLRGRASIAMSTN
jgi:hypothetical protein